MLVCVSYFRQEVFGSFNRICQIAPTAREWASHVETRMFAYTFLIIY